MCAPADARQTCGLHEMLPSGLRRDRLFIPSLTPKIAKKKRGCFQEANVSPVSAGSVP